MAGLRFPLSTLHAQPHGCPRMTRGHDGAASPFMWGSCIPYSMPVYPGAFDLTLSHGVSTSAISKAITRRMKEYVKLVNNVPLFYFKKSQSPEGSSYLFNAEKKLLRKYSEIAYGRNRPKALLISSTNMVSQNTEQKKE